MMDHSLGGPVDVGIQEGALHEGNCNDGVFGCSRCWNLANDGQGTLSTCEWCKRETFTKTLHDPEDHCTYAVCKDCREKYQERVAREYEEEMMRDPSYWDPPEDD